MKKPNITIQNATRSQVAKALDYAHNVREARDKGKPAPKPTPIGVSEPEIGTCLQCLCDFEKHSKRHRFCSTKCRVYYNRSNRGLIS